MATVAVPVVTALDPLGIPMKRLEDLTKDMEIKVTCLSASDWKDSNIPSADHLVHAVAACSNDEAKSKSAKDKEETERNLLTVCDEIDALVDKMFSELIKVNKFVAKEGKTCGGRIGASGKAHFTNGTIIAVGRTSATLDCESSSFIYGEGLQQCCSKGECFSAASFRKLGKSIATAVTTSKATSLVVSFKDLKVKPRCIQAMAESLILGLHTDDRFKSKKSTDFKQLSKITICLSKECVAADNVAKYEACVADAKSVANAVEVAKQLATAPPNYCNPSTLANFAVELAQESGMKAEILSKKDLEERKMGAFLGVGQGSIHSPYLIHLTYSSPAASGKPLRKIALVGKGITMDTGGYNLKVQGMIELMKWDMAGAAAVLGAAKAVSCLRPEGVEAHFIVAAAENMISKDAYRPGDVVTAANGTTIEVTNTDAEGRLVLCDCLHFAEKLEVDLIVDLATLTGAQMIALGCGVGCVYGSQSDKVKSILRCAQQSGEYLWPMPLFSAYKTDLESRCADIVNNGTSRFGGSIKAALFLKEFVEKVDWCHIDMAGPAWDYKDQTGSGYPVATLTELVRTFAEGGKSA